MVVIAALVPVTFLFLVLAMTSAAVTLIGRRDESRFRQLLRFFGLARSL
jgi:hypothetical protein